MNDILSGAIIMGYLVGGLFFFRHWRRAKDHLFLMFGLAFCLLALNQAVIALAHINREEQSWVYLIRLSAYLLIIFGIFLKNVESRLRGKD